VTDPNQRNPHRPEGLDGADAPEDEGSALPLIHLDDDDEHPLAGGERLRFHLKRDPQKRLDRYLQSRLKKLSRAKVQQLIALGGVMVNGADPKPSTIVRRGDRIDVLLPPPPANYLEPEDIPLHILYEDEHFVVVNKQADLIVHPARSNLSGTLINGLAYHFLKQKQEKQGGDIDASEGVKGLSSVGDQDARPGVVHRLDRFTTGCIVVAKSDECHWGLSRQFERRTNTKAYLALVHGNPEQQGGVIEEPLGKHPTIREAQAVRHDSVGKHSVTLYRVRERYRGYSLIECELKTGRTHQIRVHLSYLGFPIVGDLVYGGEAIGQAELDDPVIPAGARRNLNYARTKAEGLKAYEDAAARDDLIIATPALHAAYLQLVHPITDETLKFTAPVHEPMRSLIKELRNRPEPNAGPVATEGTYTDLEQLVPA